MTTPLLSLRTSPLPVERFLTEIGDATEIDKVNRESRAWFLRANGHDYFVKWAPTTTFGATLATDAAICTKPPHPAIISVLNVIETADGGLLVYPRVEGESLSDRARFFALPVQTKLTVLATIFEALTAIVEQGWIMEDFYEGNVLYNVATASTHLFDFECFHRGDGYRLERDRTYGSRRLMAPEEWVRGAWIDQATNVFTLGRFAICALSTQVDERWRDGFQASRELASVLERATRPERDQRYQSVRAFTIAFIAAAGL